MIETFFFLLFILLSILLIYLISKKSGNHDIDFITNILGWVLLIPSMLGLLQSLRIL